MTAVFGMTKGAQLDQHIRPQAPGSWVEKGHCVGSPDPDLWFSEGAAHEDDRSLAIAICRECPVRLACLQYALDTVPSQDWGIWGATTAKQRATLRRRQRRAAA